MVSFSFCSLSLVESLYLLFFLYLLDLLVYLVLDLLLSLLLFAFDLSFHLIDLFACRTRSPADLSLWILDSDGPLGVFRESGGYSCYSAVSPKASPGRFVPPWIHREYVFLFRWLPSRTILSSPSVPVALVSVPVLLVDCLLFRGNKEWNKHCSLDRRMLLLFLRWADQRRAKQHSEMWVWSWFLCCLYHVYNWNLK